MYAIINKKGSKMKVLSLKEPWATLIKNKKKIERDEKLENLVQGRTLYPRE